jgi:uncharacterized glyoxalase superfamily protein PhnB
MGSHHKPEGYSTVSPYLIVDGATRTLEFLKQVFQAVELRWIAGPDGSIMHAVVRIDDTVVMLADGNASWPAIPSHAHVYVPDVDAIYARALAAGATSMQAPVKKGDPDRRAGVKDPGGTTWWIATKID